MPSDCTKNIQKLNKDRNCSSAINVDQPSNFLFHTQLSNKSKSSQNSNNSKNMSRLPHKNVNHNVNTTNHSNYSRSSNSNSPSNYENHQMGSQGSLNEGTLSSTCSLKRKKKNLIINKNHNNSNNSSKKKNQSQDYNKIVYKNSNSIKLHNLNKLALKHLKEKQEKSGLGEELNKNKTVSLPEGKPFEYMKKSVKKREKFYNFRDQTEFLKIF